ncbi:hypothetical protein [Spiroplasma endosymbiont of Panorpa germanica]|uniref:hypothetical protein n=1 Tax=Spiroplasma endosymbiont of Panorpa germanica TaxID=3066314 RepID=UPI0030D122F2
MNNLNSMNLILIVALLSTIVFLLSIRLYFSLYYSRTEVPLIKSADINISSAKIEEMIQKFQFYTNCTDLKIIYERDVPYVKTFCNLKRKKKLILIPIVTFNSVGYEIDYILGQIWIASKIYNRNTNIMNYRRVVVIIPIYFRVIYYLFMFFSFALYILAKINFEEIILQNSFLLFLYRVPVLSLTSISAFIGIVILFLMAQNLKISLEDYYEMEVSIFVKDQMTGYKSDYLAARVYSRSIPYLLIPTFRITKNVEFMKYFGPFAIF